MELQYGSHGTHQVWDPSFVNLNSERIRPQKSLHAVLDVYIQAVASNHRYVIEPLFLT